MSDVAGIVGREREIDELTRFLDGPGGLMLVGGEGGVGKSRLVREAAHIARESGRPVLWSRPEQVSQPGPFALVVDLVENLAAQSPRNKTLSQECDALAAALIAPPESSAAQAPRRVAARLRGLLAQSGARPLAIFEDLHAADEASHAVIVHLARSAPDDERHLLGTYRPEEPGVADELERFLAVVARERLAAEIALAPLGRDDARALAAAVLGSEGAGRAEWVAATAEGVPFFIEELAAAFARGGRESRVPPTISRAVLERASRLGPVARQVIAAAALTNGALDERVLAVACEMDDATVARALAEAARNGLVEDRERRLVFRHALTREAIVGDLVSVEAQQLHRRIAAAIEEVHRDTLAVHAKALAHHWYEGRERARAHRFALEAGERALALAATNDARLAFELAVACTERPSGDALRGLAEVSAREGDTASALDLFTRAAEAFEAEARANDAARALGRVAWLHAVNRREHEAFPVIDDALQLAEKEGDELVRAGLLAQKGRLFRGGRDEERAAALHEALSIAERLGEHATRCDALDALAWETYCRRDGAAAAELAERACAAGVAAGRAESIGRSHNNAALILAGAGSTADGLARLAYARERLAGEFGSFGVAMIDTTEAVLRMRMGEPHEVARALGRHEVGWSHSRGTAKMLRVWAALHAGEDQRAAALLEQARAEAGGARFDVLPAAIEVAFAELIVALERAEPVPAATPDDLLAMDWSHVAPDDEALALVLSARSLAAAGRLEEARDAQQRLDALAARVPMPYFAAWALELRGDVERDASLLGSAADAFAAYPNAVDRARCMSKHASLEPDKERAIAILREARAIAADAGSSLEGARIEAHLRALGVRPRAGRPRKDANDRSLSPREEEVAVLVAAGATNAEIAARLFLSERTVQDHVAHALRKLGVGGRAGLAAWAAKQGLV